MTNEEMETGELLLQLSPLELIGIIVSVLPLNTIQSIVALLNEKKMEKFLMTMTPKANT